MGAAERHAHQLRQRVDLRHARAPRALPHPPLTCTTMPLPLEPHNRCDSRQNGARLQQEHQ
jgi:hypothetical protein